jgi:hypothetical protein
VVFKPFDIDHLLANVTQLLDIHEHYALKADQEEEKKKKS